MSASRLTALRARMRAKLPAGSANTLAMPASMNPVYGVVTNPSRAARATGSGLAFVSVRNGCAPSSNSVG